MHGVSIRTLTLLLVLLAAVISLQYLVRVQSVKADAVWLAGDCDRMVRPPSPETGITVDS